MPPQLTYLKVGIVLFLAVIFIFALFKTINFIIRLLIMGVVIVLLLFFFGIPFLVPPLFSDLVCKGPVTAENRITHSVREFPSCFAPLGWKPLAQ